MNKVEHWSDLPGCIYRLVNVSPPFYIVHENVPEFFAQLDPEFWTALQRAGKIKLSRDNQELLANILLFYIIGETSNVPVKVWGAGLTRRKKVAQWSAVAKHARALGAAIQDLAENHSHKLAKSCGHALPVVTGFLKGCAQMAEEQLRLARLEPRERGRPREDWTDDLVCSLAMLYKRAGGRVTASWSSDQTTLAGAFPAFLRVIWARLPADVRPVSVEAFVRRARGVVRRREEIDRAMHGRLVLRV